MNAKQIYYIVLAILAAIGTTLAEAVGGWDPQTKLLAALMIVDYLTGAAIAIFWKNSPKTDSGAYNSQAGFRGLLKKCVIVLMVMIAQMLDKMTGTPAMRTAVIFFFAANEGMSILENLGIMGVPYPPALKNMFDVLRRKSEDKEEKDDNEKDSVDYQGKHEKDV